MLVACIDLSVAVCVESAQCGEAVFCRTAEDFRDAINDTVSVVVMHEECIVGTQPTRLLGEAITLVVEMRA